MFLLEAGWKGMDPEERLARRAAELKPLIDSFIEWVLDARESAPPRMSLGKAFDNAAAQWPDLQGVLEDGRLALDNNLAECAIRPFAVGRKNWLFSDVPRGESLGLSKAFAATGARKNGRTNGLSMCRIRRIWICWS